jgi:hypothetical protein
MAVPTSLQRLLERGKSLFRKAGTAPPEKAQCSSSEPAHAAPVRSMFERLGDAASLAPRDPAQRAVVLQCFATDICERHLLLEKIFRGNEDADCFRLLGVIRRWIADQRHAEHVAELLDLLRQKAEALPDTDQRRILYGALLQLCSDDPEEMADHAWMYMSLRLVRYAGPFVDEARRKNADWLAARLLWWVQHGVRLDDMSSVYVEGTTVRVPDEALLLHGIQRTGA